MDLPKVEEWDISTVTGSLLALGGIGLSILKIFQGLRETKRTADEKLRDDLLKLHNALEVQAREDKKICDEKIDRLRDQIDEDRRNCYKEIDSIRRERDKQRAEDEEEMERLRKEIEDYRRRIGLVETRQWAQGQQRHTPSLNELEGQVRNLTTLAAQVNEHANILGHIATEAGRKGG